MIHSLRQNHRRALAVLGVLTPAAFIAGIVARTPQPMMQSSPGELAPQRSSLTNVIWESTDLWPKHKFLTRVLGDGRPGGENAVELSHLDDLVKPDLLIYWSKGFGDTNSLPEDAIFLGAITPEEPNLLPLPPEFATASGTLVIYSLADRETVATSKPVGVGKP